MALRKVMLCSILLVLIGLPAASFASDLALQYSILTSEGDGMILKGTLRVEVRNLGNGDLRNVDVRLEKQGPNSIEKGLFQLGSIPRGEARIATGGFLFEEKLIASGTPILWRVDYDDAAGAHKQVILPVTEN